MSPRNRCYNLLESITFIDNRPHTGAWRLPKFKPQYFSSWDLDRIWRPRPHTWYLEPRPSFLPMVVTRAHPEPGRPERRHENHLGLNAQPRHKCSPVGLNAGPRHRHSSRARSAWTPSEKIIPGRPHPGPSVQVAAPSQTNVVKLMY